MASEFPQLVANALVSGAQYSTVAVGFSVAYAGAKFFDLSFSAALAVAAYATLVSVSTMPPVVAVMVGASCSALLATTTHFLVFRPLALRKPAPETRLLASLGLLLAVVNVLGLEFG